MSVDPVPTIDAIAITLTLLLPPLNLAGQDEQDFETVSIKTTSYGILPREGARLTYEVINLQGTARYVLFALPGQHMKLPSEGRREMDGNE